MLFRSLDSLLIYYIYIRYIHYFFIKCAYIYQKNEKTWLLQFIDF